MNRLSVLAAFAVVVSAGCSTAQSPTGADAQVSEPTATAVQEVPGSSATPVPTPSVSDSVPSVSPSDAMEDCTLNGIALQGSVYFTDSPIGADFSIAVTTVPGAEDLTVFLADPPQVGLGACGVWYRADSPVFADFSVFTSDIPIQADLIVYFVDSALAAG